MRLPRDSAVIVCGDSTAAASNVHRDNGCVQTSLPAVDRAVLDALMTASRAFVGLAARSLASLDADVTLPQFRVLVILATRGPQRLVDIAAQLGVVPSTGTRMCDRLIRKGLVRRTRSAEDRRVTRLRLTPAGRTLVGEAIRRREEELTRILQATAGQWRPPVTKALLAFAAAAGEVPEQEWWLGWAASTDSSGE